MPYLRSQAGTGRGKRHSRAGHPRPCPPKASGPTVPS